MDSGEGIPQSTLTTTSTSEMVIRSARREVSIPLARAESEFESSSSPSSSLYPASQTNQVSTSSTSSYTPPKSSILKPVATKTSETQMSTSQLKMTKTVTTTTNHQFVKSGLGPQPQQPTRARLIPRPIIETIPFKPSRIEMNIIQFQKNSLDNRLRVESEGTVESASARSSVGGDALGFFDEDNDVFIKLKEAEKVSYQDLDGLKGFKPYNLCVFVFFRKKRNWLKKTPKSSKNSNRQSHRYRHSRRRCQQ